MTQTICRTALFMPANNTRAMQKACSLDADAIVMDLEDSVHPGDKQQARDAAVQALQNNDYGHRRRVLRVNAIDTEWFDKDMATLESAKPDAVLIPKVESVSTIAEAQTRLDKLDPTGLVKLWIMVETPKAILDAAAIAASKEQCARLETFCIGNNDLARTTGMKITSDRTYLIPWLLQLVVAAKAYDLQILDGVYNDFADLQGFCAECDQGAAMGMNGKTLIHPKQIEIANAAYSPSAEDIADAQLIVDTYALAENADAGILQINGRMVERLHLDMARQTLQLAVKRS